MMNTIEKPEAGEACVSTNVVSGCYESRTLVFLNATGSMKNTQETKKIYTHYCKAILS